MFAKKISLVSFAKRTSMATAVFVVLSCPALALGEVPGFNNLNGWTYNQLDGGTPADLPNSDSIHLTTGNGQRRSVFFNTPQNITEFTASFTYRATNINACLVGQGIGFVIHNDPRGPSAVGSGAGGYGFTGIANSVGTFLGNDTGPGRTLNGVAYNGAFGGGFQDMTPANAFNFRDLNVTLSYIGSVLTVSVDDPAIGTGAEFSRNYVVGSIATRVGAQTAYVGFTSSTGDNFGNGGSNQYISNLRFGVPSPAAFGLVGIASTMMLARRRR